MASKRKQSDGKLTTTWHISCCSCSKGAICLDTLAQHWSPVLTLKGALISIQGLLASPEPKDPQDAEVAGMLLKDPKEFEYKAHAWAVKYSGAPLQNAVGYSGGVTEEDMRKSMMKERIDNTVEHDVLLTR